jgi:hypothetical protein
MRMRIIGDDHDVN